MFREEGGLDPKGYIGIFQTRLSKRNSFQQKAFL